MQVGKCERIYKQGWNRPGMEKQSFPRAGINHPVAHLQSYHVMTVSDQEFDMILRLRKNNAEMEAAFEEMDHETD